MISLSLVPIVVFDGKSVVKKANIQKKRQQKIKDAQNKLKEGNSQDQKLIAQAVEIDPNMIYYLIVNLLEPRNITFLVAPFEADAQLAYLNRINFIDYVLTEDSDLIVFGAKNILFKSIQNQVNQESNCQLLVTEDIYKSNDSQFKNWNHDRLISYCILSGCDYLPNPKQFGKKKAWKFMALNCNNDIHYILNQIRMKFGQEYLNDFVQAWLTFKYQWVFCPQSQKCRNLNEIDLQHLSQLQTLTNIDYSQSLDGIIGAQLDSQLVQNIAEGYINPKTYEVYSQINTIKEDMRISKEQKICFENQFAQQSRYQQVVIIKGFNELYYQFQQFLIDYNQQTQTPLTCQQSSQQQIQMQEQEQEQESLSLRYSTRSIPEVQIKETNSVQIQSHAIQEESQSEQAINQDKGYEDKLQNEVQMCIEESEVQNHFSQEQANSILNDISQLSLEQKPFKDNNVYAYNSELSPISRVKNISLQQFAEYQNQDQDINILCQPFQINSQNHFKEFPEQMLENDIKQQQQNTEKFTPITKIKYIKLAQNSFANISNNFFTETK